MSNLVGLQTADEVHPNAGINVAERVDLSPQLINAVLAKSALPQSVKRVDDRHVNCLGHRDERHICRATTRANRRSGDTLPNGG